MFGREIFLLFLYALLFQISFHSRLHVEVKVLTTVANGKDCLTLYRVLLLLCFGSLMVKGPHNV